MRTSVRFLFAISISAFFLVLSPLPAHAATANFFGPIISPACECGAGTEKPQAAGWGCVMGTAQNSINFGVSIGIIIAVLIIATGGLMFMTSAANPEAVSRARGMMINAVVGLVIVLAAWLMVDYVMKLFYNPNNSAHWGPWNNILGDGPPCIEAQQLKSLVSGAPGLTAVPGVPAQPSTAPLGTNYTFDPGIAAQQQDESPMLQNLLSCMAGKLPKGVGRISSISDSAIVSGGKSFGYCDDHGCSHAAHSCHYGGPKCTGRSYAVDFGDDQNIPVLKQAAQACNANFINNEGTHLHVSVGAQCGCN